MGPLLAVLLSTAPGPGPDPARLVNLRFSEASEVERVRAGSWRPSDPRNGGRSVRFLGRGRMVLDWRADAATCSFSSRRERRSWTLTIDCGAGPERARWTWLPGGGARTNAFLVAAPQMTDAQLTLVRFDRDFAQVEKQYRAEYRERALQKLSGRWMDASWETEIMLDPQRLTLQGRPVQVVASPCRALGAAASAEPVICVSVKAESGPKVQLVEQGERLFECEWDEAGDGAQYDLAKGSRIFARAPAATAARP